MQYKFYDPPLDLFPGRDEEHPEVIALRNKLIQIEEESFHNLDIVIASYDYELHFNHRVDLYYSENYHIIEGLDL
nr:hypothetical protein [Synergistes sp.]